MPRKTRLPANIPDVRQRGRLRRGKVRGRSEGGSRERVEEGRRACPIPRVRRRTAVPAHAHLHAGTRYTTWQY
jgi:hypothetical protein